MRGREIGTYVSRARTALCPYSEEPADTLYVPRTGGSRTGRRSHTHVHRWRWGDARAKGGGPHVWCVYTPWRRAGRLLGGRRSSLEHEVFEVIRRSGEPVLSMLLHLARRPSRFASKLVYPECDCNDAPRCSIDHRDPQVSFQVSSPLLR